MNVRLTEGAILRMTTDDFDEHYSPIVQVHDLKLIQPRSGGIGRYRLTLSDGSATQMGILSTHQNFLVHEGQLQKGSVVCLNKFICTTVQSRRILIIVTLDVRVGKCDIIRQPENAQSLNICACETGTKATVGDRISALPDELLCEILSYVDTQCAVRTTVLSPRWNNLWTSLPNLCFSDHRFRYRDSFMTFVERVLFYHDSSDIKKFCLESEKTKKCDFSHIESWICTAIRQNVVELDLCVRTYNLGLAGTFELPQSLFTSKTLEVLSLKSNFIANPPKFGCFPSLKVLKVDIHDYFPDDNLSFGQIFSNCPVLQELRIFGYTKVLDFKISTPELKILTVEVLNGNKCKFYINAPKLEVFKANIDFSRCFGDVHVSGTKGLLEAISNTIKQLSLLTRDELKGGVPAFDILNQLELAIGGSTSWRYLMEFLKASRNLEYLVIKLKFKHEDVVFTPPESVPVCMLSHLKTITIEGFKGRQDEMRVAQYLLKCSEVLNKMIVFTNSASLPRAEEMALYTEFLAF